MSRQFVTRVHRQLARHWLSTNGGDGYKNIITEVTRESVALIRLNRPKALNALSSPLMAEVNDACRSFDMDDSIGAIIITGSERSFAAGADIKEMAEMQFPATYTKDMLGDWADLTKIKKPIIAAVNGYALGGGCELAMMCDIVLAGSTAKFGQPEITLGIIPGAGGTQRLLRAVGKSKAMELCLTGVQLSAEEALQFGLVARVYPPDQLLDEAIHMAAKIAKFSQPSVAMCKEAVNAAYELTLAEGVRLERRLFLSLFATNDQKEGMQAFVEKRDPEFINS